MDWTATARLVGEAIAEVDCRVAGPIETECYVGGPHDLSWFLATLRGAGIDEAIVTTAAIDAIVAAPLDDMDVEELILAGRVAWASGDERRVEDAAQILGSRIRVSMHCAMPEPGGTRERAFAAMGV